MASRFRDVALILACLLLAVAGQADAADKMQVLHKFCRKGTCRQLFDSGTPLLIDKSGDLFGVTSNDGKSQAGTIFKIHHDGVHKRWQYIVLYRFCSQDNCADGFDPSTGLIEDTAGNLYGLTRQGGLHKSAGVFFEYTVDQQYRVLYNFCSSSGCTDGSNPSGALIYSGSANGSLYDGVSPLYSTSVSGGANNGGTAFELSPSGESWTEDAFYSFCVACSPVGMIMDGQGGFVGTISSGVQWLFALSSSGGAWTMNILHTFCTVPPNCADGLNPRGQLLLTSAGDILGATEAGGDTRNNGLLFRFTPSTGTYQVIHEFCLTDCQDGANPSAGLVQDASGNFFGTASHGGSTDGGIVYELTAGGELTSLFQFCPRGTCKNGYYPGGPVVPDGVGNLYGTTTHGAWGFGTAFKLGSSK